jgi:5'-AMP-activated protein kinase, catalytic alpha subunit
MRVTVQAAAKSPHDWKRVGREIRILKRLKNHPAIIHVYDIITLPSEVYVVQELAQGGSLLDFVRSRKRLTEETSLRFFLQVVAGLQFCHQNEVGCFWTA